MNSSSVSLWPDPELVPASWAHLGLGDGGGRRQGVGGGFLTILLLFPSPLSSPLRCLLMTSLDTEEGMGCDLVLVALDGSYPHLALCEAAAVVPRGSLCWAPGSRAACRVFGRLSSPGSRGTLSAADSVCWGPFTLNLVVPLPVSLPALPHSWVVQPLSPL